MIVDAGCDPCYVDKEGRDVLLHAFDKAELSVLEYLMDKGCNVNFTFSGMNALKVHLMMTENKPDAAFVKAFLSRGFDKSVLTEDELALINAVAE